MIGGIRISLDALAHNARALRDLIAPAKSGFVVKGNAYGHGLVEIARAVRPYSDRLCVYSIDEAVELRDAGISGSIFIMGPVESADLEEAVARGFEFALWDTGSYLRAAARAAATRHERAAVHVKIDTGVARLGLHARDAADAIEDYARIPELADCRNFLAPGLRGRTGLAVHRGQLEKFERALQPVYAALQNRGIAPVRHIAASAAAMLWPQTRLDMARIGIALYGLWPSPQTRAAMNGAQFDLQPVLSYETRLVAVRDVEAGTPVGYGCTFHAPRRMPIGIVPLGYADGIPRSLSNRGAFLVAGSRCPIAGRVCMNMTLLDLSACPHARPGEAVTLIGTDGAESVSVADWSRWADTIDYEIVTRLPPDLLRAYEREETAEPQTALS